MFHPKSREEIVSAGSSSSTRCGSGAGSRGLGCDGNGERIVSALLVMKAEASSRKADVERKAEREAERILVELSSKDSSSGARTTTSLKSHEVITRGSSDSFHSGLGVAGMIQIHNPREVNSKGSSNSIHTGSGGARTMQIPKCREVILKRSSGSIHSRSGGARMMQNHIPHKVNSKGSSSSIHSGSGGARMMKGSSGSIHSRTGDGSRGRGLDGHDNRIMATLLAMKAELSN